MWNIIKEINYQTRRDTLTYIAFLLCLLVSFGMPLLLGESLDGANGGIFFLQEISGAMPEVILIFSVILITKICGGDMKDKTINYEILSGHTRPAVFWGRVIPALLWGSIGGLLISMFPVLILTAVNGWGPELELKAALLRLGLILLVYLRWEVVVIFLTVALCSNIAAGAVGYAVFMGELMVTVVLSMVMELDKGYFLTAGCLMSLMEIENARSVVENGEEIYKYDLSLAGGDMGSIIIWSVAVIVLGLLASRFLFCKRDMR